MWHLTCYQRGLAHIVLLKIEEENNYKVVELADEGSVINTLSIFCNKLLFTALHAHHITTHFIIVPLYSNAHHSNEYLFTAQHCTAMKSSVQQCTALHSTVLYSTALHSAQGLVRRWVGPGVLLNRLWTQPGKIDAGVWCVECSV